MWRQMAHPRHPGPAAAVKPDPLQRDLMAPGTGYVQRVGSTARKQQQHQEQDLAHIPIWDMKA